MESILYKTELIKKIVETISIFINGDSLCQNLMQMEEP